MYFINSIIALVLGGRTVFSAQHVRNGKGMKEGNGGAFTKPQAAAKKMLRLMWWYTSICPVS